MLFRLLFLKLNFCKWIFVLIIYIHIWKCICQDQLLGIKFKVNFNKAGLWQAISRVPQPQFCWHFGWDDSLLVLVGAALSTVGCIASFQLLPTNPSTNKKWLQTLSNEVSPEVQLLSSLWESMNSKLQGARWKSSSVEQLPSGSAFCTFVTLTIQGPREDFTDSKLHHSRAPVLLLWWEW
jgi:hypothetical protein